MPPVGFEPTISAGERPQTYALDRAATGIGSVPSRPVKKNPHYAYHTTLQATRVSGASVAFISPVRASAIFLFLIVGNYKVGVFFG